MQRREVVKADLLAQLVGVFEVDGLDPQQGEVPLILLGRTDLSGDDGPGLQAETANLAGRNVDVVGAGQIVVVGTAQEAETVGQDLEGTLADIRPFCLTRSLRILKIRSCFLSPMYSLMPSVFAVRISWGIVIF